MISAYIHVGSVLFTLRWVIGGLYHTTSPNCMLIVNRSWW